MYFNELVLRIYFIIKEEQTNYKRKKVRVIRMISLVRYFYLFKNNVTPLVVFLIVRSK